jgi:pimeloyl-ACP methyl ester carboxylesterase
MRTDFTVVSGQATLAAESDGTGPIVACLHAGVADRRMWRPLAEALRGSCRLVAYDRRGFGETPAIDEPISQVDDLFAVLDHAAAGSPAILVGCSQGGRIAIDAALQVPERVRALVLIAPAVTGAPPPVFLEERVQFIADALEEAEEEGDIDRINALEARAWLDGPLAPEGRVAGDLRELFLTMNSIALRAAPLPSLLNPPPAFDRLDEIKAPVLVMWGDLDFPHLQERCSELVERLADATPEIVEGTAHLPTLEQPVRCAALIAAFVAKVSATENNPK